VTAVFQIGIAVLLGDLGQVGDALPGQPVQHPVTEASRSRQVAIASGTR
jgi:hypothetical protein